MARTVKVGHINPFVTSAIETFSKMVGIEAKPGKPMVKKGNADDYDISGIIGISGGAKGMVALSFPKDTAVKVTNRFVGLTNGEMNADTIDAIGELANIVVGYAKKGLSEFNIIMVTSESEKTRILEAIQAGAANYVVKPFQPEILQEKISAVMKKAA